MLVEETLFGTRDKVANAIEMLRQFEPIEGYYLAFSGGKDSCVIKQLAIESGVKFDAHYSVTTIDPPELVRFIRDMHPDVDFMRPKVGFFTRLVEQGSPPFPQARWCCKEFKENGGDGRFVITGIRGDESNKRAGRRMVEVCMKSKLGKRYLNIIHDWSSSDVWDFIRMRGIEYCSLYDEGFDRLGCVMCPMASTERTRREVERWPKIARAFEKAFDRIYERRVKENHPIIKRFSSGHAMYVGWAFGEREEAASDQSVLFE
jgi:phosphoadenosine phosphosulfate reductase